MLKSSLAAGAIVLSLASPAAAETASVNGLEMYYEVHGEGAPIVLIHGAYMSIPSNWDMLIPTLTEAGRQVIAVELQGHGRTNDRDTPITYEGMADDVSALLDQIGVETATLFGYSMGSGVALQVAIRHPEQVDRLVLASAGMGYDALPAEFEAMIATITPELFAGTPMEAEYLRLSPHPEAFPVLVDKLKQLDLEHFDWTADVAKITVPTLLIFGDADIVTMQHVAKMHATMGGIANGDIHGIPRLNMLVLPATSHIGVFYNPANIEIMKSVVPTFLAADLPQPPMGM